MPGENVVYNQHRQVIKLDLVGASEYDTMVQVCVPQFAWRVARAYLSTLAQERSSYADSYSDNYYTTPDDADFDAIQEAIDVALASEIASCTEDSPMVEIGTIVMWGSNTIPSLWAACEGQEFDPDEYPDLYAVIGYNFGAGGTGKPRLPNMAEKFAYGESYSYSIGSSGGEKEHTLSITEMPAHSHVEQGRTGATGGSTSLDTGTRTSAPIATNVSTATTGSGGPHNNMPPYLVLNFIIYMGEAA